MIDRKQQNQNHYSARRQVRKIKNGSIQVALPVQNIPLQLYNQCAHKPCYRIRVPPSQATLTRSKRKHQNPSYSKLHHYSQTKIASSPLDILFQGKRQSYGCFPLQKMAQLLKTSLKTSRHNQHISKFADKLKLPNSSVHLNEC